MTENKEINVKDWIALSSIMIGASLTILALIWQLPPPNYRGLLTTSFLLLIGFIFFVNSVSTNSKANYEAKLGKISEPKIDRFVKLAEYTFGIGFTCVICAFALLAYGYLMVYGGARLLSMIIPVVFIAVTLCLMFLYNVINYDGVLAAFKSMKRNIWAMIEIACMVLIIIDYVVYVASGFTVVLIP